MSSHEEFRKVSRRTLGYAVHIDIGDESPWMPATMIDVSETGAKIEVECATRVPERFILLLAGGSGALRHCRVVRRDERCLGVEFEKRSSIQASISNRQPFVVTRGLAVELDV